MSRLTLVLVSWMWLAPVWAAEPLVKPAVTKSANLKVAAAPRSAVVAQAKRLLLAKDYLGFRIWIHKAYFMKLRSFEWYELKNLVTAYSNKAGFDLIPYWNARFPAGKSEIDKQLEHADTLMLTEKFEEAFAEYQKAAITLKVQARTRSDARVLLPFVLHSMGRALYGAGRFAEALGVYQWIGNNYPRIRQVLFEKMWSAFKAGNVEVALGAVASQRSAYFARFLSPEAYLIQTYLYKRLCRTDDLKEVVDEMHKYEGLLAKADDADWIASDAETLTLFRLGDRPTVETDDVHLISIPEREKEKSQIKQALKNAFEAQRPKLLADLKTASAYAHLANVTDTRDVLKPIKVLKSRDEYLKLDLEIWPADSNEDWVDEIGKHVLIGESLCKQNR